MLSATILVGGLRVYLRVYENLHAKKKKQQKKNKLVLDRKTSS